MGFFDRFLRTAAQVFGNRTQVIQEATRPASTPVSSATQMKVYGNQGRIEIPTLNISVPLYDTSTGSAQQIIDNEHSAVYLRWGQQIAVADHTTSENFCNLAHAIEGRTVATIDRKTSKQNYICSKKQIGHIKIGNGSNSIYDSKWQPVFPQNAGGLTTYTCISKSAEDVMDIWLIFWRPIDTN